MMKPRLFIGSSTERLPIARELRKMLDNDAEATVWDEAPEFGLGKSILGGLLKAVTMYDFALFVFGQDDATMIGSQASSVRDNVIFELGLLMGAIGEERALWLSPEGAKAPKPLTDLGGIVHLTFNEPDDLSDTAAVTASLKPAREKLVGHISKLGVRTDPALHEVPMNGALCLASSQYSQQRFTQDLEYIHSFFPDRVTSERGVTADRFESYFAPGRRWDIVHLGLFVDEATQLLFDPPSGKGNAEWLGVQAVQGMLKESGASLVVIITCDSLKFGEQLARFTNVVAGHQTIAPGTAINWSKVFYRALAKGQSLSRAFYRAQDEADPGLILMGRRDITFRQVRKAP
jgi:hypothetical protein